MSSNTPSHESSNQARPMKQELSKETGNMSNGNA